MIKLLRAGVYRLMHSRIFRAGIIFMAALGAYFSIQNYFIMQKEGHTISLDGAFIMFPLAMPFIMSLLCGFFIGTEYADGTIRNKFISGASRGSIYLSNFLTCTFGAAVISAAYAIFYLTAGVPLLGGFEADAFCVLGNLLCALAVTEVFTALFTLISMLSQSKANGAVMCIIIGTVLYVSGVYCGLYIMKRLASGGIYGFLYDLLPGCQLIQVCNMQALHPVRMFLYSMLISAVFTAAGMVIFKRKDLK